MVEREAVICGDSLAELRKLPADSVHCCVTSPPYWGLRDYGVAGQLGLERTPEEYVSRMVEIFAEVRRVLLEDGTLWLNLGDCYATGAGSARVAGGNCFGKANGIVDSGDFPACQPNRMPIPGLKPKDLVGIPWRVAFALHADGWYLRSEIIWHKPNPMPESVTDRPTKAHEQIFLMAKSERYWYDAEAIAEASVTSDIRRHYTSAGAWELDGRAVEQRHGGEPRGAVGAGITRNRRSVWTVPTDPYPEAHFATFPPALIEPCIKAGCPAGGTVLDPFAGSGTTLEVARRMGCGSIGIELNPAYCKLIEKRMCQEMLDLA